MTGYSGKLVFYKSADRGFIGVHFNTDWIREEIASGEKILLAEIDVDVEYADTRTAEIEALEKAVQKERASSQHRINVMLGRIQELQALEHN